MNEYTKEGKRSLPGCLPWPCVLLVVIGHIWALSGGLSTGLTGLAVELLGLGGVLATAGRL